MSDPLISIIIPAYNEADAIGDTVDKILRLPLPDFELLVVDDGSTDDTAKAARDAGATVLEHPYNIGNGAAVKTGIRNARGRVVCFLDGDGQHDPNDIPRILKALATHHMAVGARSGSSEQHFHRSLANIVYNHFASFIAEFPIHDLTSGFRAMRTDDARRFVDMFPNGFSYPSTSTLAFIRSGRAVTYLPIETKHRIGKSKIKIIRDGLEFFLIIIKIAMSFSPLRVFLPVASFLFFLGLGRYAYTYFFFGEFTNMSHLLMNSSVIIFMLGLIAEQIASLRLEKGDQLFTVEDRSKYEFLGALGGEFSSAE
ncbi:MAG: glycosyltransferase family 2 protein [Bdellovibrionales bacterium]|nr:glycosyltransferase family 2 protein [Bdellovibrionales bacterium]